MKVLVTGSGGREHALAWRLAQSADVEHVFVAPGNAGTATESNLSNVDIDVMDFDAQVRFAREKGVGLTLIGPEAPLVAGAVDCFQQAGLLCFGPDKGAAQLEGSKTFTKTFLARYGIPTADYRSFSVMDEALAYARQQPLPMVIKADGLAAGKGVVIARTMEEATGTVEDMMRQNLLGDAGARVVIEEFMVGEEASFIVIADGENFVPFASSQDHKAAYDGDTGPNTGGMGAYSPAPVVTPDVHDRIVHKIIEPTLAGMANEGHPYTGFLYAGVMIDGDGEPRVVEFNCRFGDPEAQPIMLRMQSDLAGLCLAALNKRLKGQEVRFDPRVALTVVMAAGGYPGSYQQGDEITGLDRVTGGKVFHAGTRLDRGKIVTAGGRVLGVTAMGDSVSDAQKNAYAVVSSVGFKDAEYRKDIGYRAVARERA